MTDTTRDRASRTYSGWRGALPIVIILTLLLSVLRPGSVAAESLPPIVPGPPIHLQVTAGVGDQSGSIRVSWSPPASNGGSMIRTYILSAAIGSDSRLVDVATMLAQNTCHTPDNITLCSASFTPNLAIKPNVSYTFYLRAVNAVGQGPESKPANPITLIPGTSEPGPPARVSAVLNAPTRTGGGSVMVSWAAPYDGGSTITAYEITVYQGDSASIVEWVPAAPSQTSAAIGGLNDGQSYSFTVRAANTDGWGRESDRSNIVTPVPPARVPDAPSNVQAKSLDGAAYLSWLTPYDGGSAINAYLVNVYDANTPYLLEQVSFSYQVNGAVVGNLVNGHAYTFTIVAVNAAGKSLESARSNEIFAGTRAPNAPGNVRATGSNTSATVTWDAPFDGYSQINSYIVTAYLGGSSTVATSVTVVGRVTSATFTNLNRGSTYTFSVIAVNAYGNSPESSRSNAVLMATNPDAPVSIRAEAGVRSASVSWAPGLSDGGSPITGYLVSAYHDSNVVANLTVGPADRNATIGGLINGTTYTFTVTAWNAIGWSASSAPSNAVTLPTTATAPRTLTATAGDASATVTWQAPLSDGGSPISGYRVTLTDGIHPSMVQTVTGLKADFSGLADGTAYSVSVSALNAAGQGDAASTTLTLQNLPPALTVPADQSAKYGDALSFTVSATDPEARDHLTLRAQNLPDGLTFTDRGDGTGAVTGSALAAPGAYDVTFSASDGHNPAVSRSLRITIAQQDAVVALAAGNPTAVQVTSGNGAHLVKLEANIADTGHGDPAKLSPVTYTLTSLASGTRFTCDATTGAANGAIVAACTFQNLPVDAYRVDVAIGGSYYHGSTEGELTVYRASRGSIDAIGKLTRGGSAASLKIAARYGKNGRPIGTLSFTEKQAGATISLRSGKVDALIIRKHRAYLSGTATVNGTSGYRFVATLDSSDQLGLWVTNGQTVTDLTFAPVTFGGGHVHVFQN